MVQVGKLWGDAKFASLSPYSKLLYCYLTTNQNISTLGVIDILLGKIEYDLNNHGGFNKNETLEILDELSSYGFIKYLKNSGDSERYEIVVVNHYKSLAKSKANIRKAIDEGKRANKELREIFGDIFTPDDFTNDNFKAPTPQEVSDYAMSLGYKVNGKDFVNYYADNDWYDKNNKRVRQWKSKVSKVWCRQENKLETVKGAPKGYEYFFVDVDGSRIFPESWKDGLPSHSNFIYAQYLTDEFNDRSS